MKCPKCGSEMQEEGEFVSDENEDVGAFWEGNGVWGCPKCAHEKNVGGNSAHDDRLLGTWTTFLGGEKK